MYIGMLLNPNITRLCATLAILVRNEQIFQHTIVRAKALRSSSLKHFIFRSIERITPKNNVKDSREPRQNSKIILEQLIDYLEIIYLSAI
jgi:hypothetical protein